MNREEQLFFCKKCLNRKMNLKQGLICNLTGEKATFQKECSDFNHDQDIKEVPLDDIDGLQIDELKQKLSPEKVERLRMEQHLTRGILSGITVGIIGAILWGIITVVTGFQIGYMAIAIGAGVGFTIRKFGNGIDSIFGFWGAGISLISVLYGNFLSRIEIRASLMGDDYFETLVNFDYSNFLDILSKDFGLVDLIFYGIAIFAGYNYSFRLITEKSILKLRESKRN
jgi:hypothetical protein